MPPSPASWGRDPRLILKSNSQAPVFSRSERAELMRSCAVEVTTARCKAVLGRTGGWVEHNLLLLKQAAVTSSWQVLRQRLPTRPDRATLHTGIPAPVPSVSTRHTPGTSLLPIRPGACTSCLHAGPLPMGRHAPCRLGDHEPPWRPVMPDGDGTSATPTGREGQPRCSQPHP
jgi:hypothetical protein